MDILDFIQLMNSILNLMFKKNNDKNHKNVLLEFILVFPVIGQTFSKKILGLD